LKGSERKLHECSEFFAARLGEYPGPGVDGAGLAQFLNRTRSADPVTDALAALWFARARTIAPARAA